MFRSGLAVRGPRAGYSLCEGLPTQCVLSIVLLSVLLRERLEQIPVPTIVPSTTKYTSAS